MMITKPCRLLPSSLTIYLLLIVIQPSISLGQMRTIGSIDRTTPQLDSLVGRGAKIEILDSGFAWTEGPVWIGGKDGHLLFSDIPRNTIFKWDQKKGISVFMQPSGYTGVSFYGLEPGSNGLLLNADGNLVMCEHGDRRLSVLTDNGGKRTLADNYDGKRLNSPNDAVLKSNGDIYFTDPPYGLPDRFTDARREVDFCGVYRLSTDGKVTLLTKSIERPNGIALSPDEKTLYVAQSNPSLANWTAFSVNADGSIGQGKELLNVTERVGKEPGLPDGMTVDTNGNLWASGPGGIYVLSPQGKILGRLVTGQKTSNCTFGADGFLYITADSHVCRVKTLARGLPK
ncbi:MAG: SMP-30/gluconolactonase/LRE family protein [Aureliella sp.]